MTSKSIKGTRTERNLVIAYVAESTAYSRYTYYAQAADKEEYFPIGVVFNETAQNELRHAKVFFKLLEGGSVQVPVDVDAGVIGTTAENLATAIREEEMEGVELYTESAKVADEEGFVEEGEGRHCVETRKAHSVEVPCVRLCGGRHRASRGMPCLRPPLPALYGARLSRKYQLIQYEDYERFQQTNRRGQAHPCGLLRDMVRPLPHAGSYS